MALPNYNIAQRHCVAKQFVMPPYKRHSYYYNTEFMYQIVVPNVFTPNGDGVNELLEFIRTNEDGSKVVIPYSDFPNMSIVIVDRSGAQYYEISNSTYIPWNGRVNNTGSFAEQGTYYYVLKYGDGTERIETGYTTVIYEFK